MNRKGRYLKSTTQTVRANLEHGRETADSIAGPLVSDEVLMVAVAQENSTAFRMLMQRHTKSMVGLARRITLNAADADEVVQEAFLRLWKQAPKWDVNGPAKIRTWLQRVVTNLAIDRCRRKKPLPLEAAGDPADPAHDTEGSYYKSEEAQQVKMALEALPPRQRAAIALSYYDDMSDAEAAAYLKISVGALESLLVRARKGLRLILGDVIERKEKLGIKE